jgi:hypothetical protein
LWLPNFGHLFFFLYRTAAYVVNGVLTVQPWDIILATHNRASVLKEILPLIFLFVNFFRVNFRGFLAVENTCRMFVQACQLLADAETKTDQVEF